MRSFLFAGTRGCCADTPMLKKLSKQNVTDLQNTSDASLIFL